MNGIFERSTVLFLKVGWSKLAELLDSQSHRPKLFMAGKVCIGATGTRTAWCGRAVVVPRAFPHWGDGDVVETR